MEGLITGRNFAFQDGLHLTIKQLTTANSPWAYIFFYSGGLIFRRILFASEISGPYFREGLFFGGLLSEFYGILFPQI